MSYPHLFSELNVGEVTLPNRVMMAAMSSGLADDRGRITPEQLAYYAERARGGVGLVTVEFACVASEYGISETTQVILDNDDAIPGHRDLVGAIKSEGAVASLQLQMPGQFAYRRPGLMPIAPSEVRSRRDGSVRARELGGDEIEELVRRFGDAARRATEAGYDLIELHGAHGYLLHAFMSPAMNSRNDEWGGDAERRLSFHRAVIAEIKKESHGRPLMYRLSAEDYTRNGLSIDDMVAIAPRLVEFGVDGLDVSTGSLSGSLERTIDPMSTEGWRFPLARRIREAVEVPVAVIGSRRPDTAERALAAGDADIIALGRPLLADPYWVAKAAGSDPEPIRPCTSCNWCAAQVFQHKPTGCSENPRAGRELIPLLPHDAGCSRHVVVIGGGPGGMAAAIQARSVGFKVTLFERAEDLGGGLISSSAPPNKENLLWYRNYLVDRVKASGANLRLGTRATAADVAVLEPDAVIHAGGAEQVPMAIEGAQGDSVLSAYDLLRGEGRPASDLSGPVVVYGGGETGCETAELIAARGVVVTLVSRSPESKLARAAEPLYRKVLLGRLKANPLITVKVETTVTAISEGAVDVEGPDGEETLSARFVVLAQGRRSADDIVDELAAHGVRCIAIGDARTIARIGEAVHQANEAVRELVGVGAEAPPA